MTDPIFLEKQFVYQEMQAGSLIAIGGSLFAIIFFTCILAGATEGFKLMDPAWQVINPIFYGTSASFLIGGLIPFAIASCKLRSLSNSLENYALYTKL